MDPTGISSSSPETLKKLEKELVKEGKADDSNLQHASKDLSHTEKSHIKAEKAAAKSDHTLEKNEKKETTAAKAVNKATHQHDIAVTNVKAAEKDLKMKQQQDAKWEQELSAKKAHLNTLTQEHEAKAHERESKLSQIQSELAATTNADT